MDVRSLLGRRQSKQSKEERAVKEKEVGVVDFFF